MADAISSELHAMVQIEGALKGLQDDERVRVLQWAVSRFGVQIAAPAGLGSSDKSGGSSAGAANAVEASPGSPQYEDLATFYDAASPHSDAEKALVGSYWVQVHEGSADVDSQTINTQLKHLGHGIGNVTRAFESLKSQKPALMVQLRKEGSTQQARKRFKVTSEGKKAVERMLANSH